MEDIPERKERKMYIIAINELIDICNDLELLDFIMQLLQKNIKQR